MERVLAVKTLLVLAAILAIVASGAVLASSQGEARGSGSIASSDINDEPLSSDIAKALKVPLETLTATVTGTDVAKGVIFVETGEGEELTIKLLRSYVDIDTGYYVSGRWVAFSLEEGDTVTLTLARFKSYGIAVYMVLPDGRELAHQSYLPELAES